MHVAALLAGTLPDNPAIGAHRPLFSAIDEDPDDYFSADFELLRYFETDSVFGKVVGPGLVTLIGFDFDFQAHFMAHKLNAQ